MLEEASTCGCLPLSVCRGMESGARMPFGYRLNELLMITARTTAVMTA